MTNPCFIADVLNLKQFTLFEETACIANASSISRSGQIVLPVAARREWGLIGGGFVDVTAFDSIGVITKHEASMPPGINGLELDISERKVAPNGQMTPPAKLRHEWSIGRSDSHIEIVKSSDTVLVVKRGRIAAAIKDLLPTMLDVQRECLVEDIFARDKSLLRISAATKLIHEAFPQIFNN